MGRFQLYILWLSNCQPIVRIKLYCFLDYLLPSYYLSRNIITDKIDAILQIAFKIAISIFFFFFFFYKKSQFIITITFCNNSLIFRYLALNYC